MPSVPKPVVKPQGKRFASLRDPDFLEWVRGSTLCWFCERLGEKQLSPTEPEHLQTRGAGGSDVGNCIPTCAKHRTLRHMIGMASFAALFGGKNFLEGVAVGIGDAWRWIQHTEFPN